MALRIGIVGAGGIGGYLTARLTAAGTDVALLARGAQLAAIEAGGLRLVDPDGDLTVKPAALGADPEILATSDVVIYAVKAQQLADAIATTAAHLKADALVLPFQNGVDAPDLLAKTFGGERTLTGVARIFANITEPGVITRYGVVPRFSIGPANLPEVVALRAVLMGAGVDAPEVPDIAVELWMKFLMFNAASSMTAATRCTFGQIRAVPEAMALTERLMEETAAVARARNVGLPEDAVARSLAVFMKLPDEGRTSTAHDLAEGRTLEIDWLCGALVRHGRAHGIATPVSETITGLLAPWRDGRPKQK